MPTSYIGRLKANSDMLNSPHLQTVKEAYDALFELWVEFCNDQEFIDNLIQVSKEHPSLVQELKIRLDKYSYKENLKTILMSSLQLLSLPEILPGNIERDVVIDERMNVLNGISFQVKQPANKERQEGQQMEFALSRSTARAVTLLISLAILIGGLSAGGGFSAGIITSILLLTLGIVLLAFNLLK